MSARRLLPVLVLVLLLPPAVGSDTGRGDEPEARNLILLIADGAGYETWEATRFWLGEEPFSTGKAWVRVAKACHPLRTGDASSGTAQDPSVVYDPEKAWSREPADDGSWPFAAYRWLAETAPDSAATMTAMMTGVKTENGAVNVDGAGKPLRSLAERFSAGGKAVGVVTSVQVSHATPAAAGGAHHPDRGAWAAIANEMLEAGVLDVLVGAGHPWFDDDGRPRPAPLPDRAYRYVGGRGTWRSLVAGDHPGGWTLLTRARDFEGLARTGTLPGGTGPERLLGIVRVAKTLQANRRPEPEPLAPPGTGPRNPDVPTLATLTRAALRVLERDPDGLFLVVEGGAVDWAMHENRLGRTIEEMLAFLDAGRAVTEWVEANGGWEENLVVVTSDHDHLLLGPDAAEVPFDPIEDRGKGNLPGHRWLDDSHSNRLVPLHARGAGAARFLKRAAATDPVRGRYLDDTDVFSLLR